MCNTHIGLTKIIQMTELEYKTRQANMAASDASPEVKEAALLKLQQEFEGTCTAKQARMDMYDGQPEYNLD